MLWGARTVEFSAAVKALLSATHLNGSGKAVGSQRRQWRAQKIKAVFLLRRQWQALVKGSVFAAKALANTRRMRCLSREGSGTHKARAVFLLRRQRKHKAKAVP